MASPSSSGIRKSDKALLWWGKPDWQDLRRMTSYQIVESVCERLRVELGYTCVAAYPIFDKDEGDRVMYCMIHAPTTTKPQLSWFVPTVRLSAHALPLCRRRLSLRANFPDALPALASSQGSVQAEGGWITLNALERLRVAYLCGFGSCANCASRRPAPGQRWDIPFIPPHCRPTLISPPFPA